jgi:hypothetical protein
MFLSSRFCSSRGRARLFSCSFRFSFLNWAEHGGRFGELQVASAVTVRAADGRVNYTLIVQSRKSCPSAGHLRMRRRTDKRAAENGAGSADFWRSRENWRSRETASGRYLHNGCTGLEQFGVCTMLILELLAPLRMKVIQFPAH